MKRLLICIGLLLSSASADTLRPGGITDIIIADEEVLKGQAQILDCVGAGITCAVADGQATLTVPGGGGGGTPGGATGDVQVNAGSGAFGGYAGSACSAGMAPRGLTTAGAVENCFTPPGTYSLPDATSSVTGGIRLTGDLGGSATSPTVVDDSHAHTSSTVSGLDAANDISSGVLAGARGGVGVALPTCTGDDKLTANGTQVSCATDQTGGAGSGLTLPQVLAVTRNAFGGF